jgi:hypothetical protein
MPLPNFRHHQIPIPPKFGDSDTMPEDPHQALIQLVSEVPGVLESPLSPISDGSRMASDRAASTGLIDLPIMCEHYLGGSEDFFTALLQLLNPTPNVWQFPRFSLYPLIRGVIESSGQTVWVLGPDDQRQRFVRLLQLQRDELKNDVRWIKVRTRIQDSDSAELRRQLDAIRTEADRKRQQRWQGLLDAAAPLGIEQAEFEGGLPGGYESVIREAVGEQRLDFQNGRWSAAQWVFVSGMSHPSMSRAWAGSINTPGEVGPDGLIPILKEPNPALVRDAFGLALSLHVRALVLWKQACTAPSSPDDDTTPDAGEDRQASGGGERPL